MVHFARRTVICVYQQTLANADTTDTAIPDSPMDESSFELRYIYSYFATFGDPLLDPTIDSFPDGLLQQLKDAGVNGVWLHTVLRTLVTPGKLYPDTDGKHENETHLPRWHQKPGIAILIFPET